LLEEESSLVYHGSVISLVVLDSSGEGGCATALLLCKRSIGSSLQARMPTITAIEQMALPQQIGFRKKCQRNKKPEKDAESATMRLFSLLSSSPNKTTEGGRCREASSTAGKGARGIPMARPALASL
jgi:hypothetical protein